MQKAILVAVVGPAADAEAASFTRCTIGAGHSSAMPPAPAARFGLLRDRAVVLCDHGMEPLLMLDNHPERPTSDRLRTLAPRRTLTNTVVP